MKTQMIAHSVSMLVLSMWSMSASSADVPWVYEGENRIHWNAISNGYDCCMTPHVEIFDVPSDVVWRGSKDAITTAFDLAGTSISTETGGALKFCTGVVSCYPANRTVDVKSTNDCIELPSGNWAAGGHTFATAATPDGITDAGVILSCSIILFLGADPFDDLSGWQEYLQRDVLHEMGHTIGLDDSYNPTLSIMTHPQGPGLLWSTDEKATMKSVYTAAKAYECEEKGPLFLQSVSVEPNYSLSSGSTMVLSTVLEDNVSSVRVSYSTEPSPPDSSFAVLGTFPLAHPGGGGVYSFEHNVAYPPAGTYMIEGLTAAGETDNLVLYSAPQSEANTQSQTVDEVAAMRAQNLARIQRNYWREVATGVRTVESVAGFNVSSCEYLVIANDEFVRDIAPICDYWEQMGGINVELVSVNGEIHSPAQVRDYIGRTDQRDELRTIWLVGSPAIHDPLPGGPPSACIDLVPTDAELLDYYFADAGDSGPMEYAVGRLPAKSTDEVVFYVNKELRYHWETSYGGRKNASMFSSQLVVSVPDNGRGPSMATSGGYIAVESNTEDLLAGLQTSIAMKDLDLDYLNITTLPGYEDGIVAAQQAFKAAFKQKMFAGQHVVFGLTRHNSENSQFNIIDASEWLGVTTDCDPEWPNGRPCQTFWITPNCYAAFPYANSRRRYTGHDMDSIAELELFSTEGLVIFGGMRASWNAVIGEVVPRIASKIYETDESRGRPKSIGDAWKETYNEVLSSSIIHPTGLSDFGILGDPMLFVRDVYPSTAAVETVPEEPLLASAWPTPFNGKVTMRIGGIRRGGGVVDVFDVSGRRVFQQRIGETEEGTLMFSWEAKDNAGRDVSSGVYFARVENGGRSHVTRLVYVK